MKYVTPDVKDYGDLVAITADGAVMTHLGFGTLAAVSAPLVPSAGGSGAPPPDTAGTLGSGGEGGDVAGDTSPGPGSGSGAGDGGSAGEGGEGVEGGALAFTGFPAAVVGALGAGLAAAGAAARKYLARR